MSELTAKHDIPGAQVAVLANGKIQDFAAGVLSLHTGVAPTTDSVFKIGSITKIWTATLVSHLVDEGLLDLDRPVRHHLPDLRPTNPAADSLTARHLLTHTGGLDSFHVTGARTVEEFVAALADADHPLVCTGDRADFLHNGAAARRIS